MNPKKRGGRKPEIFRRGYCQLDVYPTHNEIILTRKPLGSEETNRDKIFMSMTGFRYFAKRFLKYYGSK